MLAVFPLWTGFQGYANITFSKFLFFVAATGVWMLLVVIGAAVSGERPAVRGGSWAVLALAAAAFVSAAFSPYGADVLLGAGRYDGLVSLLLYCFIFLGVSAYGRHRPAYVWALAFSLTVCCAVSLLQLLGHADGLGAGALGVDADGHHVVFEIIRGGVDGGHGVAGILPVDGQEAALADKRADHENASKSKRGAEIINAQGLL